MEEAVDFSSSSYAFAGFVAGAIGLTASVAADVGCPAPVFAMWAMLAAIAVGAAALVVGAALRRTKHADEALDFYGFGLASLGACAALVPLFAACHGASVEGAAVLFVVLTLGVVIEQARVIFRLGGAWDFWGPYGVAITTIEALAVLGSIVSASADARYSSALIGLISPFVLVVAFHPYGKKGHETWT